MKIEAVKKSDLDQWRLLVQEVEPLFGPMIGEEGFQAALISAIHEERALGIRNDAGQLCGIIVVSYKKNAIEWLAVTGMERQNGYGEKLLNHAINRLNPQEPITVQTFDKTVPAGLGARKLYMKCGFLEISPAGLNPAGFPTVILKRAPVKRGVVSMDPSAIRASGAFVESLSLKPLRAGTLDGLTFTVKDNIDLGRHKTSFGSPGWREEHPAAIHNALCVDQLLNAGATCVGKVVADEFTYSLDGENPFFGTPLNAKVPSRVPGGSSSGSASSVACGLADFSLGTDSGGSIRVPASLCGVWGMRPSLHRISEAGVLPFMPSVSTVGAVAAEFDILDQVMRVLLRSGAKRVAKPQRIVVLEDAFKLADEPIRAAAESVVARMAKRAGISPERVNFADIAERAMDLAACNETALRNLQTAEFQNTVGDWIENYKPKLGRTFSLAYGNVKSFDRMKAIETLALCERLFEAINRFLQPGTIICFPTTPTVAPLKGSLSTLEAVVDFYNRTMAVTSFSGVGRLPEISLPLLSVDECPVGLSVAAAHYQDEFLLATVREMLPL